MATIWENVAPGATAQLAIPLETGPNASISLPVFVARGRLPGKTLVSTAGVHGDEFEGMAALRQVFAGLNPEMLRGTLVAVPVANPPAYEAGSRVNPADGQDLARVFPGRPDGTATERIAHFMTEAVLRGADFYCDLHSGGQYYAIQPLVGYQLRSAEMLRVQREAAGLFGLPVVWGTPVLPGRSLSAAGDLGVPALYAEVTGEGRCRPEDVARHAHGLRQLLRYLGILPEPPEAYTPTWVVEDDRPEAGFLQAQNVAPAAGYFEPAVGLWDEVRAGQLLGMLRDALGQVVHEARAPHGGRVVFLRTFPRVGKGEALATVLEMRG